MVYQETFISKVIKFIKGLCDNWNNPDELKLIMARALLVLYYSYLRKNKGEHVALKEWDNLIIIDACRHDILEKELGKKVDYIISRGSATPEWLIENFKGKKYKDIVYVTANPFVDVLVKDSFYKVISVWKLAWNKKHDTVLPKDVVKYALIAKKMYPKKRLIVHFMQPHYPFVRYPEIKATLSKLREYAEGKRETLGDVNPWELARKGKIPIEKVWEAYTDNLKFVLSYALGLGKKLGGKSIISSDHGNVFKRVNFLLFKAIIAGHPKGIHFDELIEVPWYVV